MLHLELAMTLAMSIKWYCQWQWKYNDVRFKLMYDIN